MAKRAVTNYSTTERIGALMLSLRVGVPKAAKTLGIPDSTIYTWFQDVGGLAEVRNFVEGAALVALSSSEQAIYEEVERRAGRLNAKELMLTYRSLVEGQREAASAGGPQAGAQAGAVATTELHVHVDGEDIVVQR